MTSPTQKALASLRRQGYMAEVVEKWIPKPGGVRGAGGAGFRKDFLGCIDIIAVGKGQTIGVQACSIKSVSDRVKKIREGKTNKYPILDRAAEWCRSGNELWIWGFDPSNPRKSREVELTAAELDGWIVERDEMPTAPLVELEQSEIPF